jgi:hypothetical protein
VAPPVAGTGTIETVSSSVASTDPPTIGIFQALVIETASIVATTSSVSAPALQTQTEGQPDSSESEEDTSQFVITPRSSAPDSTAFVSPSDP